MRAFNTIYHCIIKRLLMITLLLAFLASPVIARELYVVKVFDAVTVALSANSTSSIIDLAMPTTRPLLALAGSGYFSLQIQVTGDGTAKFEYLLSNDGTNFLEPSSATDIASGITKTSGPGSDGKDIFSFAPLLANFIQIKVTETAGANSIIISAWLAVQ